MLSMAIESLPLGMEFRQVTAQRIFSGEVKSHTLAFPSLQAPPGQALGLQSFALRLPIRTS